jgi:hypothetical protein
MRLKVSSFEARRFSANLARPPSCESPLKIQRYLVELLAIRILIAKSSTRWRTLTGWKNRRIFLKTSAPLSLIMAYRMNLTSAGMCPAAERKNRRIFLKTSAPLSLIMAYRMNLISAVIKITV